MARGDGRARAWGAGVHTGYIATAYIHTGVHAGHLTSPVRIIISINVVRAPCERIRRVGSASLSELPRRYGIGNTEGFATAQKLHGVVDRGHQCVPRSLRDGNDENVRWDQFLYAPLT